MADQKVSPAYRWQVVAMLWAIGIHQTSVYIGTIAGGFFAGLIGQVYGWRWSFVIFGGLGILLGLALNRWLREPRRGQSDQIENAVRLPVRDAVRSIWTSPG